jgi:hypothetical protein
MIIKANSNGLSRVDTPSLSRLMIIVFAAALGIFVCRSLCAQEGSALTDDPSLRKAAILDSIYRAWTEPDSLGRRYYWFRHSFDIDEQPTGGHILIAADDNYALFLNGTFIAEDRVDTLDWMTVNNYDIGGIIQPGRNILAIQAYDVDRSGQGLKVGLVYETVPDLDKQLEQMTEREVEQQQQRRQLMASGGGAKETAPAAEDEAAQQKLREQRIIVKNKLY